MRNVVSVAGIFFKNYFNQNMGIFLAVMVHLNVNCLITIVQKWSKLRFSKQENTHVIKRRARNTVKVP